MTADDDMLRQPDNMGEYLTMTRAERAQVTPETRARLRAELDAREVEHHADLRAGIDPDPETNGLVATLLAERQARARLDPAIIGDPLPDEPRTELGYAHRFVDQFGHLVRFVPTWNRWLLWDGTRWNHDTTKQHRRWMTVIARAITNDALAVIDSGQTPSGDA